MKNALSNWVAQPNWFTLDWTMRSRSNLTCLSCFGKCQSIGLLNLIDFTGQGQSQHCIIFWSQLFLCQFRVHFVKEKSEIMSIFL